MTNPQIQIRLADGNEFRGEVVAVLDETAPPMGDGVYFIVTTAVIIEPDQLRDGLVGFFAETPGRKNPFHWHKEGPTARARMIDMIIDHHVIAISAYQAVARNKQTRARKRLLEVVSDKLVQEQIDHLIIESGDHHSNLRDRKALLDHHRPRGGVPFAYDWRSKQERLLWVADAISGAIADNYAKSDSTTLERLISTGVLKGLPEHIT